jgi:hypothetical protein
MSAPWNLQLEDGILTVELASGIESADFERLYDGIVREISAVERVHIDVGATPLTATGSQLLGALVAQLEARGLSVTLSPAP